MDIEKTIQFILEQQAHFWSGLQQEREANAAAHAALEAGLQRVAQNQLELSQLQRQQQEIIGGLTLVVRELAEGQRELREAQQQTTQNLNALIKTVDDLIRRDGHRS